MDPDLEQLAQQYPNWAAIIGAERALYPDQTRPLRWAPKPADRPSAVESVTVYRAQHPAWHWHYITEGLSGLGGVAETAPDAASGAGYELTMRVLDAGAADPNAAPPQWPVNLLRTIAADAAREPGKFPEGRAVYLGGSVLIDNPTAIDSLAFVADRQLAPIDTASGRVEFRQIVGITRTEQQFMLPWNPAGVLGAIERRYPMLITMLERGDLGKDPSFVAEVTAGIEREGSSTDKIGVTHLKWLDEGDDHVFELMARDIPWITKMLPGRLGHGRGLYLVSGNAAEQEILLILPGPNAPRPGAHNAIVVDPPTARALAASLQPTPGDYRVDGLPGVVFRVVADQA